MPPTMSGMPSAGGSPAGPASSNAAGVKAAAKAGAKLEAAKSKKEIKMEKKLQKERTKIAVMREHNVHVAENEELKVFTFEEGPLGMKFEGEVEDGVATVNVSEVLPSSQAAKLEVPVGAIIKLIGVHDITRVDTMDKVLKAIGKALRPVEITMEIGTVKAAAAAAEAERLAKIAAAEKAEAERKLRLQLAANKQEAASFAKAVMKVALRLRDEDEERERIKLEEMAKAEMLRLEQEAAARRERALHTVQAGARGRQARKTKAVLKAEAEELKRLAASMTLQRGARTRKAKQKTGALRQAKADAMAQELGQLTAARIANDRGLQGGVFTAMASLMCASKQFDNLSTVKTAPDPTCPDSARELMQRGVQAGLVGLALKREAEAARQYAY